jgi:hypothetical protein
VSDFVRKGFARVRGSGNDGKRRRLRAEFEACTLPVVNQSSKSSDEKDLDPKPATSTTRFFLADDFEKWIRRTVGIPHSLLHSLESDDDWTFVIKMHAIVEAALNHLLMTRLNNPRVNDVIAKLATNDRRKGKIAFIKAYDLLPENSCLFVQVLSEVRNTAVHNPKNFNLDLTKYVAELKEDQRPKWKRALSSWWVPFPDPQHEAAAQHEAAGKREFESALDNPRHSIFSSCIHILASAQVEQMNSEKRRNLQNKLENFARR